MGRGACQGGWVVIYTRGEWFTRRFGTFKGVGSDIPGGSGSPGDLVRGTKWDVVCVKGCG